MANRIPLVVANSKLREIENGDTLWVDDNDDAMIDPTTGEQGVTLGLKSQWKTTIKEQAGGLLQPTDWMVIMG